MVKVNGFPLDHFYRLEAEEAISDRRFRLGNFVRRFSIRNHQDAPDYDDLMLAIFQRCIDVAKQDGEARMFSCIMRSPALKGHPIQVPYRSFKQNTATVMLHEFKKRQQSEGGIKLLELGPLTVEIVTGPIHPFLPPDSGSGGCKAAFRRNVNTGSLIEVDNRSSNLCLFMALELTRKYHTENGKTQRTRLNELIRSGGDYYALKRLELATKLLADMRRAGLAVKPHKKDNGEETYSAQECLPLVEQFYKARYAGEKVPRLVAYNDTGDTRPMYKGETCGDYDLGIYLETADNGDGHFHGIRCLSSFFGVKLYCVDCEKTYNKRRVHTVECKAKCTLCCGIGPGFPCAKEADFQFDCPECHKRFYSRKCLQQHLHRVAPKASTVCENYKSCTTCGQAYNARMPHKCFHKYCRTCYSYHRPIDLCCVQKRREKKDKHVRFVAYDFECSQDRELPQNIGGGRLHQVNAVSAYLLCTKCIDRGTWRDETAGECDICGQDEERQVYWSTVTCNNPLTKFLDWLFQLPLRHTTIAFAHYGGRYDMHFILGEIYRQGNIVPSRVKRSEKLYQLVVRRKNKQIPRTLFRDTFNLMPLKLEKLPKSLGLDTEDKGFFPHLFNCKANLLDECNNAVRLPTLPAREYYDVEGMTEEKAAKFDTWYDENVDGGFCLAEALEEYCTNDVNILVHAIVKFREVFKGITGKDIMRDSITIAAACIDHFIEHYMNEGDVGIIPEQGYNTNDRQSTIALKYLKWRAFFDSANIRHRDTPGGEKRLQVDGRTYKIDGFIEGKDGARDLAIEFNGCAWHGHECIYGPNDDAMCPNGKTALRNRLDHEERMSVFRRTMDVETVWECDVKAELRTNEEMRKFFKGLDDTGPLYPRDAYVGGRTGPLALKCDLEEEGKMDTHEILNLDIVSLYPYINFTAEYPIGHGRSLDFNERVNWTKPEHNPYKGLVKCFVVPPTDLVLPVIPKECHGKLMFPLCNACVKNAETKSRRKAKPFRQHAVAMLCPHTRDEDRGFVTTITHLELNVALEKGYRVTHLYSAVVWDQWSRDLFKDYIRDFMKIKVEASGWPDSVGDDPEKRQQYIDDYQRLYGITINAEDICDNPGLKYVAKICLNSMWGRWSLRNDYSEELIETDPIRFWAIINDPTNQIGTISRLCEGMYMVNYKKRRAFLRSHAKYNVVLSLFTTSAARCHLYSFMDKVEADPDCRLLYTDTDSVIIECPKGRCPIAVADMLGEMNDQYPKHTMAAYYAPACKAYVVRMYDKRTGEVKDVVKAKGVTIDIRAKKSMNFATYKEMVDNFGNGMHVRVMATLFKPDSTRGRVVTKKIVKTFRGVFDKAMVDSELKTLPFGYRGST